MKIQWSWTYGGTTAPDSYNLYRGTSSGGETIYQTGLVSPSYLDTAITLGNIYFAYVTEVIGGIEGPPSTETSVQYILPLAPLAPVFSAITSSSLMVVAQTLTTYAVSQNIQYSQDSTFSTSVTTITNVSSTGTINIGGFTPNTLYYVRFVDVNASGSTAGPYSFQLTRGTNIMAVENASVLNGQQLFVETTPGTPGPATVRLLMTMMSPNEAPDKKAHTQEGIKFPVEISDNKEYTDIKYDGTMAYNDMAYICATALVKPIITTPANNSTWNVTGATGTIGFTFKGQTIAPATYTTTALMQAALGGLSSVGVNNVIITGTVAAPIIKFVAALSTDTSALTVAGTPLPVVVAANVPTLTRRFTFLIDPFNPDVLQTYTLEKGILGQSGMAEIISSIYGTTMSFTVNKSEQKISGDMIGQISNDPSTMTTILATGNITAVPITAKQTSVFLGDNANNVTRVKRALHLEFQAGDRTKPVFTLDDSVPSFTTVVEGNVSCSTKLTILHNTESQSVLAAMRANALKWLIYESIGPVIETGFPYRFKVTMPVKVLTSQKQDVDGGRAGIYDLQPIYNPNLASAASGTPANGGAILVELDIPLAQLG